MPIRPTVLRTCLLLTVVVWGEPRVFEACWSAPVVVQDDSAQTLQNSTQKLRVLPSKIAARIGSAVRWRDSWETALEESRTSGKPIFWYVATVPGTFTDRKTEIDRYMMGGPFSWPSIIDVLNKSYIPLRVTPAGDVVEKFALQPYKFVEPGFLILDADANVIFKMDRLTTWHPQWLRQHIQTATAAGGNLHSDDSPRPSQRAESIWRLASDSPYLRGFSEYMQNPIKDQIAAEFDSIPGAGPDTADSDTMVQLYLMKGMMQYYAGQHEEAKDSWRMAIQAAPDHPLAWKAAAEREGFGPFVRGFEVLGRLPDAAWEAGFKSAGSAAPPRTYTESELWQRGAKFLVAMQRHDGAVIDSDYDFGGTDSLPNVYVAVTSLVGLALMEAQSRAPEQSAELQVAIQRAADFVRDEANINRADRDEILWAYAYRLRFLAARYRLEQEDLDTINRAVQRLESVQGNRGSWYHEYSNSFVTATALIALFDAAEAGATVNQDVVQRGVQALLRDRHANGAFPYHSVRGQQSNQERDGNLAAAAGRMPVCELALKLWSQSDQERLQFAVHQSLLHHDKLFVAYKYDNHTSTLAYGGFFFWYDMRSRAEAIRHLADSTVRNTVAQQHRDLILELPELDGCFVDSHELGRCYGTAMALLSLAWLDAAELSETSQGTNQDTGQGVGLGSKQESTR